jgi:NAD(P)-dependent dehydrogenase (short-subunit alcohol dehydrogenase family)
MVYFQLTLDEPTRRPFEPARHEAHLLEICMTNSFASKPLSGRTALITGGAGGFGLASALALAQDGAAIMLTGRNAKSLQSAKERIEREYPSTPVSTQPGDANREADLCAVVQATLAAHGSLDIVVATVGGTRAGMVGDQSTEDFMEGVALSLRPAYVALRACVPAMPKGGAFAFISSTAAVMPFIGLGAYCAGKVAVDHLARVAANELGARGFRFNVIRPGVCRTGATVRIFANQPVVDSFLERVPLGRLGEPEEVAAAVRYLVGPESRWTTGQSFAVDGGNELRGAPLPG